MKHGRFCFPSKYFILRLKLQNMSTKKIIFCAVLVCIFLCGGCAQKNIYTPQKEFKSDSDYYMALRSLDEGNTAQAVRLFTRALKKSSFYCARKSAEELTRLGNVQERQTACMNLISLYKDEDALIIAAAELFEENEYAQLISATAGFNYETGNDILARLRLESLKKKNDSRYCSEALRWFSKSKISAEHYKFFKNIKDDYLQAASSISSEKPLILQDETFIRLFEIADFRLEIYTRNYTTAYKKFNNLKDRISSEKNFLSDIGKAALYGSKDFLKNAQYFDSLAALHNSNDEKFFNYFYSGRLYEKAGNHTSLAEKRYMSAMECAENGDDYDNALWYLLNLNLAQSTQKATDAVKNYCRLWHNPEYFDDFFETLSPRLLSESKWDEFYDLYTNIDGYASDAVTAKFAYIYGRLLEEKIALPKESDAKSESYKAFSRALKSGSSVYYKIMAITALGINGTDAEQLLLNSKAGFNNDERDINAESYLLGFAAFGLPEKIYPEWQKFISRGVKISLDTSIKLASFLRACGHKKNEYYTQSLRIAAKSLAITARPPTLTELELLYPRDYSSLISDSCKKYCVPEEFMYALVRSESFFDSEIKSSAGAVGLAQLMEFTAADVAKKLNRPEYSLKNAADNIEFGTYYISELVSRLDGKWLHAFFAYNAGIQRVRRWIKSSEIEFGRKNPVSYDIFLETVPYTETREYGRKLISAAAMYAFIYYQKEIGDTVVFIISN